MQSDRTDKPSSEVSNAATDRQPSDPSPHRELDRRAFLRRGLTAAGTVTLGGILLSRDGKVIADPGKGLPKGDVAILKFLAAAETLETDAWQQYNELCGVQDAE